MTLREDEPGERFLRVVGRRTPPPAGMPTKERRDALDTLQPSATRAPKGVFRYSSHEAANAARDEWTTNAIADRRR